LTEDRHEVGPDNSAIVHTIMLWRIYDVLVLLLGEFNPELAAKVGQMHEAGHFIAPGPSLAEDANEDD
jgi:hypothetical protein